MVSKYLPPIVSIYSVVSPHNTIPHLAIAPLNLSYTPSASITPTVLRTYLPDPHTHTHTRQPRDHKTPSIHPSVHLHYASPPPIERMTSLPVFVSCPATFDAGFRGRAGQRVIKFPAGTQVAVVCV